MRYWIREIAGWVLLVLGLFVFYLCFEMLLNAHIVQAGMMTVIGVFIFRGGLHLLKVAVAAQVCLKAQEQIAREERARPAETRRPVSRPAAYQRTL